MEYDDFYKRKKNENVVGKPTANLSRFVMHLR